MEEGMVMETNDYCCNSSRAAGRTSCESNRRRVAIMSETTSWASTMVRKI